MKYILSKIPIVEDLLRNAIGEYFSTIRWSGLFANYPAITISNDHPFERLLNGDENNTLFPTITVVSNTDGEIPTASKNWETQILETSDLVDLDNLSWYVSDDALAELKAVLATQEKVYGLSHSTTWRDSVSCEIWAENMQVKNDIYSLIMGFLTGPSIMEWKQASSIVVSSATIRGQRSGYYNYDFGRVLYGARVSFEADYPIIQAVYDTEIRTLDDLNYSYREVLHG